MVEAVTFITASRRLLLGKKVFDDWIIQLSKNKGDFSPYKRIRDIMRLYRINRVLYGVLKAPRIMSILQVLCKYKIVQKNLFKWTELNSVRFYVIRKISTCQ